MRIATLVFIACLAAGSAPAQTIDGTLTLGGKLVPLPPGPWRILHQATEAGRTTDGNIPTTMHRAVLVQERGGQAAAIIIASAAAEVGTVWNPHGICVNPRAVQRQIESAIRGALDCRGIVVIGSGRGATTPAYLNALYDEGERRPGWIPPRWLSAQIVLSERMNYLAVEYRYAPSVFGPAVAGGVNWHEGARSAAQQAVIERLATFSASARAGLQAGLRARRPDASLPEP